MRERRKRIEQISSWVGLGLMAMAGVWMIKNYMLIEGWMKLAGGWAPLLSIGLYALLSLTPIPSDPLTLLNGMLFGWTRGTFISWLGNMAAAIVEYGVALKVSDLTDFETYQKKLPVWLQKFPVDSPWFLIVGRFIPVGGKLVSIMAGAYKVPLGRYLWTTAVVNMIGALIYSLGGWGLVHYARGFLEWMSHLRQII